MARVCVFSKPFFFFSKTYLVCVEERALASAFYSETRHIPFPYAAAAAKENTKEPLFAFGAANTPLSLHSGASATSSSSHTHTHAHTHTHTGALALCGTGDDDDDDAALPTATLVWALGEDPPLSVLVPVHAATLNSPPIAEVAVQAQNAHFIDALYLRNVALVATAADPSY